MPPPEHDLPSLTPPAHLPQNLRISWHAHLGRVFRNDATSPVPWHRHLYRMVLSLGRDYRYSPPPAPPPPPPEDTAESLTRLVQETIHRHIPLRQAAADQAMSRPRNNLTPAARRLFLDVTFTARHNHKSGIQRVVRNIARQSRALGADDLVVIPVEIKNGELHPCRKFEEGHPLTPAPSEPIHIRSGDVFVALDSGWGMVDEYEGLFPSMESQGVIVIGVVYDLIPITHCHFFKGAANLKRAFPVWIGLLFTYSRTIIGISKATRDEVGTYLAKLKLKPRLALDYFHLGFDQIEIQPAPQKPSALFAKNKINLLMIGTLETRKGYDTALDAFDRLRADRPDIALHLVGKEGWNIDDTLKRIKTHPLLGTALFWHAAGDDALLAQAYAESTLLIAASRAEGFGLPLVEAARLNLPIVASNLPVFSEIAAAHVYYFPVGNASALAKTIRTALRDIAKNTHRRSAAIPVLSWKASGEMLLRAVSAHLPSPGSTPPRLSFPPLKPIPTPREIPALNKQDQERHIEELLRLVQPNGHPNLHTLNQKLKELDIIKLVIKQFGHELATRLYDESAIAAVDGPSLFNLRSKPCTQSDMDHPAFRWWIKSLRQAPIYHRKIWEYAFVLQALYETGMLQTGKRGLAFAVGEEPLPAYLATHGVFVKATDAPIDVIEGRGWTDTGQHADSIEKLYKPALCPRDIFDRHVSYDPVDMRTIPAHLDGGFDFCWSICSFEHLGSLAAGADFVVNSLKTLRPGGVAVHTSEFNYLSDTETVDNWGTVLYRKKDFEALAERIRALGYGVHELDFDIGSQPMDSFIDLPPYNWDKDTPRLQFVREQKAHLRLSIDGFACTSFGLIIRKPA